MISIKLTKLVLLFLNICFKDLFLIQILKQFTPQLRRLANSFLMNSSFTIL